MRGFGVTCAAVAASTLGLLVFAHASSFDTLLTTTVTGALACFYCSEVERGAGTQDVARRLLLLRRRVAAGEGAGGRRSSRRGGRRLLRAAEALAGALETRRAVGGAARFDGGGDVVRAGHRAPRADVRGRVLRAAPLRALRLEQVSPPAALLVLPAGDAGAGAAVDGVSGGRDSGGRGDERARGGRGEQTARAGARVARGAGALLLGVGVEAAGLRAAGAAGRGVAGGRRAAPLPARRRRVGGDEADGPAGAAGLRRRGRVSRLSRRRVRRGCARALAGLRGVAVVARGRSRRWSRSSCRGGGSCAPSRSSARRC